MEFRGGAEVIVGVVEASRRKGKKKSRKVNSQAIGFAV